MTAVNSGQLRPGDSPTVTPRFTQAILQTAERLGLDLPGDLVAAVQAEPRVSLTLQDRLWQVFCEQCEDPLAGLELGLAVQVGHLDAAGMLLTTCETLDEALESLLDYHPIVGEGGDFSFLRQGPDCAVVYTPHYKVCRAQRVEAVLACLLHMTRWATGEAFAPTRIRFTHSPLTDAQRYAERLELPVVFEQQDNALEFPATALALPLIQANPDLCRHLRTLADQLLSELGSRSLSAQVGQLLREHPRWGKEKVADRLDISGRHLVRKLAEEGASFKLLRASLLQDMAEQSLTAGASTAAVAERLGFSDESAFSKAFKRWTGLTPAQFRDGG